MRYNWGGVLLIALSALCALVLGFATEVLGSSVKDWLQEQSWFSQTAIWMVVFLALVISIGVGIIQYRSAGGEFKDFAPEVNRQKMIDFVRLYWISGVLDKSLDELPRIDLGFENRPDAVENPLRLQKQEAGKWPMRLPRRTPITQVFDEHASSLLILGAPGSGKTTFLLELARDLLDRAKKDPSHKIPVVFNLSSWAQQRLPIKRWLVEELIRNYEVPPKLAQQWVDGEQVLPLLDGIDEVEKQSREACFESLNNFLRQHAGLGPFPIAVCGRIADYELLTNKMRGRGAVRIEPLTPHEVQEYLRLAGNQLEGLQSATRRDPDLLKLLDSPFMLSIANQVFQEPGHVENVESATLEEMRRTLFDQYVNVTLERRQVENRYSREQTLHWLKWLASSMRQNSPGTFRPVNLDRTWLPKRFQKILTNLVAGAIYGFIYGIINSMGLILWLSNWTIGLISWLVNRWFKWEIGYRFLEPSNDLTSCLVIGLAYGLMVGLANELVRWVKYRVPDPFGDLRVFSWLIFVGYILIVMTIGILIGWLRGEVLFVLISGTIFWGVILISWLVVYALLQMSMAKRRWKILLTDVWDGLIIGDEGPFNSSWSVRLVMWLYGYAPFRYVRFLDYATERIFLYKVGKGYIFVHGMLMDYFASLRDEEHQKT